MIWPQFTGVGITPVEFRRLYQCEVGPDPRLQELTRQLQKYYEDTKDADGRYASKRWAEFREWTKLHGFEARDVRDAKLLCSP